MSEQLRLSKKNILISPQDFQKEIHGVGGFYDMVHPICSVCGGNGMGNDCPSCGGEGCERCNSGVLRCAECRGHGRMGFS